MQSGHLLHVLICLHVFDLTCLFGPFNMPFTSNIGLTRNVATQMGARFVQFGRGNCSICLPAYAHCIGSDSELAFTNDICRPITQSVHVYRCLRRFRLLSLPSEHWSPSAKVCNTCPFFWSYFMLAFLLQIHNPLSSSFLASSDPLPRFTFELTKFMRFDNVQHDFGRVVTAHAQK